MVQRQITLSLMAAAALGFAACSGGSATVPVSTPADSAGLPSTLGQVFQTGLVQQSALAIYTIELDPASLTATTALKALRQGAANDDLYLLSIDGFLTGSSFRVTGIAATAETIDLTWELAHPFPAPADPAGTPNGFSNRADLGIAGQVVYLADVPSAAGNTYFGSAVANTGIVANADAYLQPRGLLNLSGSTANTFPYHALVDETGNGSRVGVSNGGDPTGNFGSDGWTRAELAAGWTGYGVLHQGQTTRRVLSLDRDALSSGFALDVAVLAKYNDPRGGITPNEKKANRLPGTTADASRFAYRMPHGALDVERIEALEIGGTFLPNEISGALMSFRVTDWDARAQETAEVDLSADASFTNVAQGESGLPALAVCIPDVLGDENVVDEWDPLTTIENDDSAFGGDADEDSGRPGDALFYTKTVTKTVTSGQTDGTYTGMIRATDPEPASLTIPLTPDLAALTNNLPEPVSYQAFTVDMINLVPCELDMSAVNTTLATLTTGGVLRGGTSVGQPVTGIRVGWSEVTGAAEYVIERGNWPAGSLVSTVVFASVGTVLAGNTSFDDTTIDAGGSRFLYRVSPRCAVGGSEDLTLPSELAMAALQNFETEPAPGAGGLNPVANLTTGTALTGGWHLNFNHADIAPALPYSQVTVVSGAINGTQSLEITELHENGSSNTNGWEAISPPALNDRAGLGNITVSQFELCHHWFGTASGTSGFFLATNSDRPVNGVPAPPAAPNNWRWIANSAVVLGSMPYNDINASGFTNTAGSPIGSFNNVVTPQGGGVTNNLAGFFWNFGVAGVAGFSAFDASAGTFGTLDHDFVFILAGTNDNSQIERVRFDDLAWLVF